MRELEFLDKFIDLSLSSKNANKCLICKQLSSQLSGVQNGPAQEYKKTIPDKVTLLGNLLEWKTPEFIRIELYHGSYWIYMV